MQLKVNKRRICQRFLRYLDIDSGPLHIHVKKGGAMAKYNILPISLVYNHGFKPSELKMIEAILEDNEEVIAQHWNTFFNNAK